MIPDSFAVVAKMIDRTFDLSKWEGYPVTPKLWGRELLLVNNDVYCAKLLVIEPGFACSLHRHLVKRESFFILQGKVRVEFGRDPSYLFIEDKRAGDCLHLPTGTFHRFWTPTQEQAVMLEVSMPHSDADVERLQESAAL